MWRNCLAAALRNLNRNRVYSSIKLFGLVLGLATAILIVLYVSYEYSFDRFWPNHERLFIVTEAWQLPGKAPQRVNSTFSHIAPALKADFPDVETVVRMTGGPMAGPNMLTQGDKQTVSTLLYWTDPTFFDLFPVRAIAGNLATALQRPDGLVITSTLARRMFGRDDVAGERIELNRARPMEIAAVIEDLPANSYLTGEAFASSLASSSPLAQEDAANASDPDRLRSEGYVTYGRLRPGAKLADLNAAMTAFTARHAPAGPAREMPGSLGLNLVAIGDLHFAPPATMMMTRPGGDVRAVQGMMAIAGLILFVAASNFVNMMTARSSRRAVEVGVRKALGGERRQLMAQFMAEAVGFTLAALAVAAGVVAVALPKLGTFLGRNLVLELTPEFILATLAGTVMIGLLAGAYPALVLSAFRPSVVLKGTVFARGGSSRLRQALVVGQFAVLIALVLVTATIYRQTDFAITQRLKSLTDQIYIGGGNLACTREIMNRIDAIPGVRRGSCVGGSTLGFGRFAATVVWPDGRQDMGFRAGPVDENFFATFDLRPLAGRLLSAEYGADELLRGDPRSAGNPNVVINEGAARALGYATPDAAIGQNLRWHRLMGGFTAPPTMGEPDGSEIVGVVPDFAIGSVRNRIEPTVYYIDPSWAGNFVVSMDGARIPEVLKGLEQLVKEANPATSLQGRFYDQMMRNLHYDIVKEGEIFAAFAAVTIVIGCLGLFALAVFTAERATKEIGIRKAMGASRMDILRFFGWRFVRPVLLANVFAWPVAYFFMRRWLDGFAYHVSIEPLHFVLAGGAAVVIALLTVSAQSLRASRAKPVASLRYE